MDLILDLKKQVPKNEDFTPERSLKTKVLTCRFVISDETLAFLSLNCILFNGRNVSLVRLISADPKSSQTLPNIKKLL